MVLRLMIENRAPCARRCSRARACRGEFETRIKRQHLLRYFDNERHRDEVVSAFSRVVQHVDSHSVVADCADADDNKFLVLALDSGAKLIVTGDKDLLALHPWRGVEIGKAGDFARSYKAR